MSAPSLKKKKERHYRRGYTGRNCGTCDHFVLNRVLGIAGIDTGAEGRCKVLGLQPGRQYRVLAHYICDAHDGSERLRRLKNGHGC